MLPADAQPDEEHPVIAAMKRAPIGKPFPPDLKAYLDHRLEEIRAGRAHLVPHEEVMAGFPGLNDAEHGDEP